MRGSKVKALRKKLLVLRPGRKHGGLVGPDPRGMTQPPPPKKENG